ncbi:MAG: peptidoglycan-binding domain-containing protein [Patescibacteria group bacterium]
MSIKKLLVGLLAVTMVLGLTATSVQAVTLQEVLAALNDPTFAAALNQALTQMNSGSGATSYTFTRNLTLGSTGEDVKMLQQWLNANGFMVAATGPGSPGMETMTFGGLTKKAVMAWQASVGISPASGYFGPISREYITNMGGGTGTTGTGTGTGSSGTGTATLCPNGMTLASNCTLAPGQVSQPLCPNGMTLASNCALAPGATTPTTPSGITTPGVEGILTAEVNPTPSSGVTVREGEIVPVLGIKLKAVRSDLSVQSIRVNLGTSKSIYTKIFKKFTLVDEAGNVMVDLPLSSSTVSEEGTTQFVVFSGFNYIIPAAGTKVLTVKAELYASIDSGDQGSKTLTVPANGVRAIDGAGVDQKSPATAFSNSVTADDALLDAATLTASLATESPLAREVVATDGSSRDEINGLELLKVNLKSTGDKVRIRTWPVSVCESPAGGAAASTLYLFDGDTEISSATVSGTGCGAGGAFGTFSNLTLDIPKDTTKAFTIKAKLTGATDTVAGFAASTTGTSITAENSEGTTVTPTGTASSSEVANVRNKGLEISLLNKGATTNGVPESDASNGLSTSTLTATFTVRLKAVDGDVVLGLTGSATPAFASSTTGFKVYRNGSYDGAISASATNTSYSQPTGKTVTSNSFTLSDGESLDVPVTFTMTGRTTAGVALTRGSVYAIGMEGIQWAGSPGAIISNFMAGNIGWRTSDYSFP